MSKPNCDETSPRPSYALGHSDRELKRLTVQARLAEPITRQFFSEAGLAPGMHVLDVGSGAGDVAILAADMVGANGSVIGTDRSPTAIATAQARAEVLALRNVTFRRGDPTELEFDRPFDAVAGRLILLFYPDPALALQKLARHLRPGGVMVFHETDWSGVRSFPPSPTYDRCCQWFADTFRLLGTDTRLGIKLHGAFIAAGLPAPTMRLQAFIGGGVDASDWLFVVAELVGVLLPEIERLGVATAAEVGIDTLFDRMQAEVIASGSVIVGRSEIGVWSRL